AHERFDDEVAKQSRAAATQTPAVQPNASDLAWLAEMQTRKGADGRRLYEDPAFRAKLERARVDVFAGRSIKDLREGTEAALNGRTPARSEPAAPPQGTPVERAFAELDAGAVIPISELPAELLFGYSFELPPGYGLSG